MESVKTGNQVEYKRRGGAYTRGTVLSVGQGSAQILITDDDKQAYEGKKEMVRTSRLRVVSLTPASPELIAAMAAEREAARAEIEKAAAEQGTELPDMGVDIGLESDRIAARTRRDYWEGK